MKLIERVSWLKTKIQEELRYIGIDEKGFLKGHKYITVVSDLDHAWVLVLPRIGKKNHFK